MFLGFTNFYWQSIHHYSELAIPLQSLTTNKAKETFNGLTEATKQAFNQLELAFTTAPVLWHFDPLLLSTLITDASDYAFAAILLQSDTKQLLHPVSYYSPKFSPAEINYEIHNKELLAIVDSLRDMRTWLIGSPHPISVISDHKNLEYFMTSWILNHHQARWSMFLSEFDFKLDYAPGKKNPADAPSRCPDFIPQEGDEVVKFQNKSLLTDYNLDCLFPCLHSLSPKTLEISSPSTFTINNSELLEKFKAAFWADTEWHDAMTKSNDSFTFSGNLVFHNNHLFISSSLRPEIIMIQYSPVIQDIPLLMIWSNETIPGLVCEHTFDNMFHHANIVLKSRTSLTNPMTTTSRYTRSSLAVYHYGFYSKSTTISWLWFHLVVCNCVTQATHFIHICGSMDAPELSCLYLDQVFCHHGFPQAIVSDRGSIFILSFFTELMKICGTKMKPSTAFHPQTDGLTEQTNQTLEMYLHTYCS